MNAALTAHIKKNLKTMVKQYSHTTTLINRKVEKITHRSKLTVASRLYCAYMKRRKYNKILTCQRQTLKNKNKKINSLQLATRHPPHSEAMQKENEAAQTGLQENKGPQQEVMLHYQPLASYYITLEFPLAVRMQAERRLWKYAAPRGLS